MFFTGADESEQTGRNGNSILLKLTKLELGQYAPVGANDIITGKSEASQSANSTKIALNEIATSWAKKLLVSIQPQPKQFIQLCTFWYFCKEY